MNKTAKQNIINFILHIINQATRRWHKLNDFTSKEDNYDQAPRF